MALAIPERIAQVAEHFAKHSTHGYSQPNRGTGNAETISLSNGSKVLISNSDVDCSEMVRQCVNAALSGNYRSPIEYMWTGDEDEKLRARGFVRMAYNASKVRRGDILWVKGHTGVAVGNGKQADAHGDEVGGITGPKRGDQTGHEVEVRSLRSWTYMYRYVDQKSIEPHIMFTVETYPIVAVEETNVRAYPSTDDSVKVTGELLPGQSVICDGFVEADDRIWSTYINNSGQRRYVSRGIRYARVVAK